MKKTNLNKGQNLCVKSAYQNKIGAGMKKIYILPLIVASLIVPLAHVYAVDASPSSSLESATNKVDSASNALVNIKDSSPSPVDQLTARMQVISDALDLATKEVTDLKANLANLPPLEPKSREAELAAQYRAELDSYLKYYQDKSAELSVLKDETTVKSLAREIVDFRTNGYNAEIDKIADFSLLFYTSDTIGTAIGRLNKIVSDINRLDKLSLLKLSDFGPRLSKINDIIKDANLNYLKAQVLILAPDNSPTTPITPTDSTDNKPEIAKDYIKNSLSDIKSAYDIFLQVSRDVRKTLGLSSK